MGPWAHAVDEPSIMSGAVAVAVAVAALDERLELKDTPGEAQRVARGQLEAQLPAGDGEGEQVQPFRVATRVV